MKSNKIPEATVMRMSIYSRFLFQLMERQVQTVSSNEIGKGVGVSSAQVRKDLAYFGEFGTRGVGYRVKDLYGHIMNILGLGRSWNVVIIGAGKLGAALSLYKGFIDRGFKICAILDNNKELIGNRLLNIEVESIDTLNEKVSTQKISIGIITVPAVEAQNVTNALVESGVKAILNFSPTILRVPNNVILRNVDLSVHLEVLSFNLTYNSK